MKLSDNPYAYAILGCAMRVHATLGCGFLESAYGDALEIELNKANIPYKREDEIKVYYGGIPLKTTYRSDFTCFHRQYIVELKAVKNLTNIERAQVRHYLKATGIRYALLINFATLKLQYDTFDTKTFREKSGLSNVTPSPRPILSRSVSGALEKSEFEIREQ